MDRATGMRPIATPTTKVIVVTEGSIEFGLPGSGELIDRIGLVAGDRLELPAGTDHEALVGPSGVRCLEAHLPARMLARVRRFPAGEW